MPVSAAPEVPSEDTQSPVTAIPPADKVLSSFVLPVIAGFILIALFGLYYFVYVRARREYLANRNFRALAVLGEQLQMNIRNHASILEYYADQDSHDASHTGHNRTREDIAQFLTKLQPDLPDREARTRYLAYLAPRFQLISSKAEDSKGSRLEVQRRDGQWELVLTSSSPRSYKGSIEIGDILRPFVASLPFDDILLAAEDGSIIYEKAVAGPQFTTLSALLQNQADSGEKKAPAEGEARGQAASKLPEGFTVRYNTDRVWQAHSLHLTEVMLAGTRYKVFLQPVLVDVFSDTLRSDEPSREWVLCGLIPSASLDWESLAISYTLIIWFTALFLVACFAVPLVKVFFLNHRERLKAREPATLGVFLFLLAGVLTFAGLQTAYFDVNEDNSDAKLRDLAGRLSNDIHLELRQMRRQLISMCVSPALRQDLRLAATREVIRKSSRDGAAVDKPPLAQDYPYFNNAFWTDYDGHQVVKWSTSQYVTPMIGVSQLSIYRRLTEPVQRSLLYLDGAGPPFVFDSVLPPNKLEYLAALGIKTCDCNPDLCSAGSGLKEEVTKGAAFIVSQPASLIDPILPAGYGFALQDRLGRVVFHADKTRNARENFEQESDWNRELHGALFGRSTDHTLRIKYKGKDYRARVVPVAGVSQSPWALIVYRDLTPVRTLNLQAMSMAATIFLLILAVPVVLLLGWRAVHRVHFVPEWIWPHEERLATYRCQVFGFAVLNILFLYLGFRNRAEEALAACAAVPYTALVLAFWSFRLHPGAAWKTQLPGRRAPWVPAVLTAGLATAFIVLLVLQWGHMKALILLPIAAAVAARPLFRMRREFPDARVREPQPAPGANYRICHGLSILLLVLLIGVLVPLSLFRTILDVERRLRTKDVQLHLASVMERREGVVSGQCADGTRRDPDCDASPDSAGAWKTAWRRSELDPLYSPDVRRARFDAHSAEPATELYSGWLRRLVYGLHHDYNDVAAEMLGVIPDRAAQKTGADLPEWSWSNRSPGLVLRKHGFQAAGGTAGQERDLVIESDPAGYTRKDAALKDNITAFGIVAAVILVIGGLFWALARRIFLYQIVPLRITGERLVEERIREGRNILVLLPPVSNWELDGPKHTIDIRALASRADWTSLLDTSRLPVNQIIEIRHFEHSTQDPEVDNCKFELLDRLMERGDIQVVVVMTVQASPEEYQRKFPGLEVIDLRYEPFIWLAEYEGPAQELLWRECAPLPALWPIGAQVAREMRRSAGITEAGVHTADGVATEILERADQYYRLIWKECTHDQKFVLAQLAADGALNPTNERAIQQLVRRGLIVNAPQFRIMNESFRRFLLSAPARELKREWVRESRRSGWGKLHGTWFTVMVIIGAFLLTTQNELWQSSAAYVTTGLGALGTLLKLFNSVRGGAGGPAEKSS